MSKKQFPLGEDDDEALIKRIDEVAREKGLPSSAATWISS
jgi:hypothetical protein